MLWEMWQHLKTNPSEKYAKKMGYLKESIAMAARAQRCYPEWQIHYEYCKTAIMQAAKRVKQRRKVLIFGAGSLNDIPLSELSSVFKEVILVDLVFLQDAVNRVKNYPNVTLVEHDVSESLSWIFEGQEFVQNPQTWLDDEAIDLVVSLNLITQLPLIPVRWLMQKHNISHQQAHIVGQQIIFSHLMYLKSFTTHAEVCLIADRLGIEFNKQAKETDRYDPWWDIEPPHAEYTWQWEVIPLNEGVHGLWRKNIVGMSFL